METTVEKFVITNENQFNAMGLPRHLYKIAARKLLNQTFDAGSSFHFVESSEVPADSTSEGLHLITGRYTLCASQDIAAFGDVFLVDHMWSVTVCSAHVYDCSIYACSSMHVLTFSCVNL